MRRWTCALGHRIEADSEEELIVAIQTHMRIEHGLELSLDRIRRDVKDE